MVYSGYIHSNNDTEVVVADKVNATEAAERKVGENDLDLANISGSGSGGRVTADDVDEHLAVLEANTGGTGGSSAEDSTEPAQDLIEETEATPSGDDVGIVEATDEDGEEADTRYTNTTDSKTTIEAQRAAGNTGTSSEGAENDRPGHQTTQEAQVTRQFADDIGRDAKISTRPKHDHRKAALSREEAIASQRGLAERPASGPVPYPPLEEGDGEIQRPRLVAIESFRHQYGSHLLDIAYGDLLVGGLARSLVDSDNVMTEDEFIEEE